MKTPRRIRILQFSSNSAEHRSFLKAICGGTVPERCSVSSCEEALKLIYSESDGDIILLDNAMAWTESTCENNGISVARHVSTVMAKSGNANSAASVARTDMKVPQGWLDLDKQESETRTVRFGQSLRHDPEVVRAQLLMPKNDNMPYSRNGISRDGKGLPPFPDQEHVDYKNHVASYYNTWMDDDSPNSMVKGWWIIPSLVLGGVIWFLVFRGLMLWFN